MGIATFNGILHHMQNRNADRNDDEIFEDELYHTMRRLNFAEEQDEAKAILSFLQSMAEIQKKLPRGVCSFGFCHGERVHGMFESCLRRCFWQTSYVCRHDAPPLV